MSYHGTSSTTSQSQSQTNAEGQLAPTGYHYMPDGTLMLNSDHDALYSEKTITSFEINLLSLTALTETRTFSINGDNGAVFSLEVRNEDSKYYNFITNLFQVAKAGLYNKVISKGSFAGSIVFPTVTDNDQYDISLSAQPVTTRHTRYNEVRFGDGSLDINSTTGSNSLLITKVIYQYVLNAFAVNCFDSTGIIPGTPAAATINISSGASQDSVTEFTTTFTVANDKALRITRQPSSSDAFSTTAIELSTTPLTIPGENIYPAISDTDTVDGAIEGSGSAGAVSNVKVVMDNNVATNLVVGDKITAPVSTDTVNGDFSGGAAAITMDNAVASKMAIGDQVTGTAELDAGVFLVDTIDSTNVFSLSAEAVIADGTTLTFTPKCNRSLTTVVALNPDTDNVKEFSMSQNIGFIDGVALSFSNQKNYRWPATTVHAITTGMVVIDTGNDAAVAGGTLIADYLDTTTVFAGTEQEKIYINKEVPAIETTSSPTIVRGEVTAQAGNITFNTQLSLTNVSAEQAMKVGGFGQEGIRVTTDYEVVLTNLVAALTEVSTTTTAAVINSTSVPVTSRNGILDNVSTVSGIGINPALANPTVSSGAGAVSGAGTIVLNAPQTLEKGAVLKFANAGLVLTITGDIQILKAGTSEDGIIMDISKFANIT